ncbi:capsid protein [Enterobacter roggenkampii]|uniref:capsid protein n=1 Tax=Enterobacter roggenkampii TaxID=1812935 RepID=UPI00223000B4|nr:capsid protein [Enterobacter roggenkampii]MDM9076135.1 capsid protein [Enterobacter roggenkampii]HCM9502866.1 capsid protein [Enterobacter roggenkampii]
MKPETVITPLQNVAAQQSAESSQLITDKLSAFTAARNTHTASMKELKEIDTSIERCKQERQTALSESAEAEQDWRSRFRTLRGNLTPEMKAEHSKRIASRELADEFTGLIAELETDRTRAMLNTCSTASKYLSAHDDVFTAYAGAEWAQAINAVPVALIRAFLLRIRALEMKGDSAPQSVAIGELRDALNRQGSLYHFDMKQEPVLSVTGMHRPQITGVDTELLRSPAKRMMLARKLAENDGTKAEA